MKIKIILSIVFWVVSGCTQEGQIMTNNKTIWNNDSQRIIIEKSGGFAGISEMSKYSRKDMSEESIKILESVVVNNNDVECIIDAFAYEITIIDKNGKQKKYYDRENVCEDVSGRNYVDPTKIEAFMSSMNVNI